MQAEQAGLKSLGRTIDMLGPYQAAGAFVMRSLARERNRTVLERYIAAYVEALRWVRDPANRAESVALLVGQAQDLGQGGGAHLRAADGPALRLHARTPPSTARASGTCWRCAPRSRAAGSAAAPERYVDLGYYERAMKLVGR